MIDETSRAGTDIDVVGEFESNFGHPQNYV